MEAKITELGDVHPYVQLSFLVLVFRLRSSGDYRLNEEEAEVFFLAFKAGFSDITYVPSQPLSSGLWWLSG